MAVAAVVAAERGLTVVAPYDDWDVMAGQGTAALELLDEVETLDVLMVPVGGGGLVAGCATAAKGRDPAVTVVGVEPAAGDDHRRSLAAGRRVRLTDVPRTLADGQAAQEPGVLTFEVNRRRLDAVVTVSDAALVDAVRFCFERLRIVVEPSGRQRPGRAPGRRSRSGPTRPTTQPTRPTRPTRPPGWCRPQGWSVGGWASSCRAATSTPPASPPWSPAADRPATGRDPMPLGPGPSTERRTGPRYGGPDARCRPAHSRRPPPGQVPGGRPRLPPRPRRCRPRTGRRRPRGRATTRLVTGSGRAAPLLPRLPTVRRGRASRTGALLRGVRRDGAGPGTGPGPGSDTGHLSGRARPGQRLTSAAEHRSPVAPGSGSDMNHCCLRLSADLHQSSRGWSSERWVG